MPNGDPAYKIGELAGTLEMVCKDLAEIKERLDKIDKRLSYLEKVKGAIGLTKWVVSVIGVGTIFNLIAWIISVYRG
ncbi:MAG: hypothetical protein J7L56_03450 [Halomonas sp.]|nr:hypothetical protein [Halomonas sp.]MCD6437307.1 hypothetical protein [Halomonas sp.]